MDRKMNGFRPRLESLEDRAVPAVFNVTAFQDNLTPGDGKRTLREAINAANAAPGADTIVLRAGVYRMTLDGAGEDANATGDFDITDDIVVRGAGAGLTVINGQKKDRLFHLTGSTNARFVGLTLRNGETTDDGGAIFTNSGTIAIVNCSLSDNKGDQGGAVSGGGVGNVTLAGATVNRNVALTDGGGVHVGLGSLTVNTSTIRRNLAGATGGGLTGFSVTLTNSTVSDNSSATSGGGIFSQSATITGSTISGNSSINSAGGIRAANALTVTNSTISGNSTNGDGGGLLIGSSLATIRRSTVSGNFAAIDGGGVFAGSVDATNSTFSGNSAGRHGGGIETTDATLTRSTVSGSVSRNGNGGGVRAQSATMINSTISGNTAVNGNGGGLAFHVSAAASLENCTVAENTARGNGGGIWRDPAATDPTEVRNTIVARNYVAGIGPDVSGDFASLGSNLIGDITGATGFLLIGDHFGDAANPLNPRLAPLANNGGPTKTHALLAGSLALDNGNDANLPPTDQRGGGFPRQKDGNGDGIAEVDIGAFEM